MRIKGGIILFTLLLLSIQCTNSTNQELSVGPSSKSIKVKGDWIVTNPETVHDTEINLTGDLIVTDSLTLNHVTLRMNCSYPGEFGIRVEAGGFLRITNGSKVVAVNPTAPYTFRTYMDARLRITNSEIHHCGYSSPNRDTWGLYIYNANYVLIRNSTLSNNYAGLVVYGHPFGTAPVVEDNIIANNTLDGVWTGYSFALTYLRHNWIIDNGRDGVTSWGYTELIDNIIARNRIGLNIQKNTLGAIRNNTIIHNRQSGILINDSYVTIEGNIIAYNNGSGIIRPGTTTTINHNNIFGNRYWGVADVYAVVNVTHNWWGSPVGPEVTAYPDATDPEEINGTVDYEPWLTAPYPCGVPPQIRVLSPAPGEPLSGSITVSAQVASLFAVERVDFFVDDVWVATDAEPPYAWTLHSFLYPDGAHTVSVVAVNFLGVQGEAQQGVVIDNQLVRGTMLLLGVGAAIGVGVGVVVVILVIRRRRSLSGNGTE